jgi:thiol-disulfide isomerase/thioredoxin
MFSDTKLSERACRQVRRAPRFSLGLPVLCVAALALLAGCEMNPADMPGKNLRPIESLADFQQQVVRTKGPVMVAFNKHNCPTCVIQEAVLDDLAVEYRGRVAFASMTIMEADLTPIVPEVKQAYKLDWVPTTILFVDGKEYQRWIFNHGNEEFRPVLDKVLSRVAAAKTTPSPGRG